MKKLELSDVEIYELKSEIIGETFEILVKQPDPAVVSLFGDKPLPVVYGTDANLSAGTYVNTIDGLFLGGEIPPVIFIGIRYKLGDSPDFMQFVTNRTREFAPTEDKENQKVMEKMTLREVKGGGAEDFLKFLTTELRDWVSERFNVSDDTTYIGDSMGGLFGLYTLFHQPTAFKRYVIGSPWQDWDHPKTFEYEEDYAKNNKDLEAIVYMASGAEEHIIGPYLEQINPVMVEIFSAAKTAEYTQQIIDRLKSRNYPNLRLKGLILEEETHFTITGALFARGLRYVFNVK
jgi:hypothetical protein